MHHSGLRYVRVAGIQDPCYSTISICILFMKNYVCVHHEKNYSTALAGIFVVADMELLGPLMPRLQRATNGPGPLEWTKPWSSACDYDARYRFNGTKIPCHAGR